MIWLLYVFLFLSLPFVFVLNLNIEFGIRNLNYIITFVFLGTIFLNGLKKINYVDNFIDPPGKKISRF